MAVEIKPFFNTFAERFHKENSLSDITYALCQSDIVFKQFLLDFFFGNDKINCRRNKVEIIRELQFDAGRPDFSIYVDDEEVYLIEVKIWDGNHHFSQYTNVLKNILEKNGYQGKEVKGHLGYIANYEIDPDTLSEEDQKAYKEVCDGGKTVKTWKDFACRLESYQAFNDPIIQGYINYLQNVCPYDDFYVNDCTVIAMKDFSEIAKFVHGLEQKIHSLNEKGVYLYNSSKKYVSMAWMGLFFELRNFLDKKSVWGWIGTKYTDRGAIVCVEFENKDGWGKLVCDQFRTIQTNDNLCFYLKDKNISWEEFLEIVIEYVKAGDGENCPPSIGMTIDCAAIYDSLLSMKTLPWLMDKYLLSSSNRQLSDINHGDNNWDLSSSDAEHNDSEQQGSHCGRYYSLRLNGKRFIEFWLGVLFNKSLQTKTGKSFSECPRFLIDMSKEDFERIKTYLADSNLTWYEIKEWNRVVHDIIGENDSRKFREITEAFWKLIKAIIEKYTKLHEI